MKNRDAHGEQPVAPHKPMKKPKHKKKLNKTRTAELHSAAKIMPETIKEDAALQPLDLVPQASLGTEVHQH